MQFQILNAQGYQRYFWRIKDGDDVLARSETLYKKSDAIAAANKLKNNTAEHTFEIIGTGSSTYPYAWHVQAKNNEIVVQSTNRYQYYSDAYADMNNVERNAPYAEIVDLT